MTYYAHSGTSGDKSDWQTMPDHAFAVAQMAEEFAAPFGLKRAARVAGMFHDLGKYDPRFPPRLEGANVRVDHSTAGAAVFLGLAENPADRLMAELCAYAILGHHAGLPDKSSEYANCFRRRVAAFENKLDPVWREEIAVDLSGLMPPQLLQAIQAEPSRAAFDLSVVARMLFSCLVDADFKDTERHYAELENRTVDREWLALQDVLTAFNQAFEAKIASLPKGGDLNRLRSEILAHVRAGAAQEPGLFTLTVPTGGGKTLTTLGFALDHAKRWGHHRIIFSIPFTSIIDQVAAIFRDILGDAHVLEHHSAIEEDNEAARRRDAQRPPVSRDRLKLAMEDWAAPVVVTTNVQFFESLFAARTSRARKLHNIANSVIVLDEAQTIPRHLLKPCVRMLDTLARLFRCTIVLCTATQPALGRPAFEEGLDLEGRELAPNPEKLAQDLRRARIVRKPEAMDNAALVEALRGESQALVIVNSRKHALDLYEEAKAEGLDGLVHLTTRQYAAHRRAILESVRQRLKNGKPCRVVATSLVEAGVDVDFPKVWRAEAGLEQIVQAAGRCNREGRRLLEHSIVTVFTCPDYPPPREIKGLIGDMGRMADKHPDLMSLKAIEDYFGEVYWRAGKALDREDILGGFSLSRSEGTDFAFRSVAEKFRMIESGMEPVIVARDTVAMTAVKNLGIEQIPSGKLARELQPYTVQVPPKARQLLIANGHVAFERPDLRGDQFAVLKTARLYRDETGLWWEDAEYLALEKMML